MFQKLIVIDGRGHLMGRLAAIVAKEALCGQKIVVVRCEQLEISGALFRNKIKFEAFLQKKVNTNPRRGPFHHRTPARMFLRAVRGMLPHKTPRGAEAMKRIRVYNGLPHPFDKKKRMVVPVALRALRLRPERKFTLLGDLSHQVGWTHQATVDKFEAKRKLKSAAFYRRKSRTIALRNKISASIFEKNKGCAKWKPILEQYGY